MSDNTVLFTLIDDSAKRPERKHSTDAGADLSSIDEVELQPLERKLVSTGVRVQLPENTVGYVCSRSGLAAKQGVSVLNAPGVVDEGYTGELKVILVNLSNEKVYLEKGTRIAQFVVQKVEYVNYQEVSDLDDTERGNNGFGSTGL